MTKNEAIELAIESIREVYGEKIYVICDNGDTNDHKYVSGDADEAMVILEGLKDE